MRQEIAVRKDAEAALRESEQRTLLLLDSTAEGIYGLDLQGQCTFSNRAALRLLGYADIGDLLRRNLHDLTHHTHADGSRYPASDCPVSQTLRTGEESVWQLGSWCFLCRPGGLVLPKLTASGESLRG